MRDKGVNTYTIEQEELALREVNITTAQMFATVMQDADISLEVIRCALPHLHPERVQVQTALDDGAPEVEKTIMAAAFAHAVRMDVYYNNGQSVINLEMQVRDMKGAHGLSMLPLRARYNDAMLTLHQLPAGKEYDKLLPTYVIFLCTFDAYGQGAYLYSFERTCKEVPGLSMGDQTYTLFFNTKGTQGDITPRMRMLLDYMNDPGRYPVGEGTDPLIQKIEKSVGYYKQSREWRENYMLTTVQYYDQRLIGMEEGEKRGVKKGEKKGERKALYRIMQSLTQQNLPDSYIAQTLMLTEAELADLRANPTVQEEEESDV
jgi:predicted transposase/invertase (TIGR01784 family)